jgi:hypothetical protein
MRPVGEVGGRDLGGRLRRGSATPHLERQHPAASHLRHGCQPLVRPRRHHAVLRPARKGSVFPRAIRAGPCRRPRPVGPVNDPHWTSLDHRRVRHRPGKQPAQPRCVNRSIAQSVTCARPAASKHGRQAVPYQRTALWRREHRVQQFEQAILTKAQVVVQRLTEVAEPLPSIGFDHTPSLARFHPNRKTA